MARILCTLPNAAELINGIPFAPVPEGMLSGDVAQEIADLFLAIPGYAAVESVVSAPEPEPEPAPEIEAPRRGRPPKVTEE